MSHITIARMFLATVAALATFPTAQADVTQADIDAYNAAVDVHNARVARYETAVSGHNSEADSYNSAVEYYNSLPDNQRTQFQYDRLERWCNDLENRLGQLNAEYDAINYRAAELEEWYNRLC